MIRDELTIMHVYVEWRKHWGMEGRWSTYNVYRFHVARNGPEDLGECRDQRQRTFMSILIRKKKHGGLSRLPCILCIVRCAMCNDQCTLHRNSVIYDLFANLKKYCQHL